MCRLEMTAVIVDHAIEEILEGLEGEIFVTAVRANGALHRLEPALVLHLPLNIVRLVIAEEFSILSNSIVLGGS